MIELDPDSPEGLVTMPEPTPPTDTVLRIRLRSNQPVSADRVRHWLEVNNASAVSMHQGSARTVGDPDATPDGWAYVEIVDVVEVPPLLVFRCAECGYETADPLSVAVINEQTEACPSCATPARPADFQPRPTR